KVSSMVSTVLLLLVYRRYVSSQPRSGFVPLRFEPYAVTCPYRHDSSVAPSSSWASIRCFPFRGFACDDFGLSPTWVRHVPLLSLSEASSSPSFLTGYPLHLSGSHPQGVSRQNWFGFLLKVVRVSHWVSSYFLFF
ncbi:hypothetical protein ADUPG1_000224, partial [Aduncisulcus paluster]